MMYLVPYLKMRGVENLQNTKHIPTHIRLFIVVNTHRTPLLFSKFRQDNINQLVNFYNT